MKAMLLSQITLLEENPKPLTLVDLPIPEPGPGEVLLRVLACGVCHTELDEIEGRTPPPALPMILGHQVVGLIEGLGPGVRCFQGGERVGVGWIYSACGQCVYCKSGRENLCASFKATGRDAHGGYAEYMLAKEDFVYPIPPLFSSAQAAPLLCAGAIGYRALSLANLPPDGKLGLTGFGASAHLVLKMVRQRFPQVETYVFARSRPEQQFARQLGAVWAGDPQDSALVLLDSIIDTTPAWKPVIEALRSLKPGGRLIINAIRKEESDKAGLLELDYSRHLWLEKEIKSVANVTRRDIAEFLELAARIPILPEVQSYRLEEANRALRELKARQIRGAKVLEFEPFTGEI